MTHAEQKRETARVNAAKWRAKNVAAGLTCMGKLRHVPKTAEQRRRADTERHKRRYAQLIANGLRADGKPRQKKEFGWKQLRATMNINTTSWDDVFLSSNVSTTKREVAG
jgi:hypothetical protein